MTAPLLSSLVPAAPGTRLTIEQTVARIEEEVAVRPRQRPEVSTESGVADAPSISAADLLVPDVDWTWEHIRDYVIRKMQEINGIQPRQKSYIEDGIFKGFLKRHGQRSSQIARYAFEVAGGYWKNAPISVNRFCANSDPYFSDVIKRHIIEVEEARALRA